MSNQESGSTQGPPGVLAHPLTLMTNKILVFKKMRSGTLSDSVSGVGPLQTLHLSSSPAPHTHLPTPSP